MAAAPSDDWVSFVKAYREEVGGLTYSQALAAASKEWRRPEVKERWLSHHTITGTIKDHDDSDVEMIPTSPRFNDKTERVPTSVDAGEVPKPKRATSKQKRSRTQVVERQDLDPDRYYQKKYYQLKLSMLEKK